MIAELNNIIAFIQRFKYKCFLKTQYIFRVLKFEKKRRVWLIYNQNHSTWYTIHNLLHSSISEPKKSSLSKHLIGASLQLRFPNIQISNAAVNVTGEWSDRPGDFLVGHAAFHIATAPMRVVFEKCAHNIAQGYKPFLLVPDNKLIGARQNAESISPQQISVESIESFVSQNIEQISSFKKNNLSESIKELIKIYNRRVDSVETDKSLMIELPSNLL